MVHFRFGQIRLPDTCESALTGYNSAKPPETFKTSVYVQKRIRFPLDARVEIAFITEKMPNFQHEHLYSPSLTCLSKNDNA